MRTFDFAPYRPSWIGFDHLFDLLENARQSDVADFPQFDLEQTGENDYRLRLAVAGFAEEDLDITAGSNRLVVSGRTDRSKKKLLYQGITRADFERQFQLADYVVVTGAKLVDGVLEIELERQIPEAVKPHKITIGAQAEASRATGRRRGKTTAAKPSRHTRRDLAKTGANRAEPARKEPILTGAW